MSLSPSTTVASKQRVTQGRLNNLVKTIERLKQEKKISLSSWKTSEKHVERFGKDYELLEDIARKDANSLTRGAAIVAREKFKNAEAGLKGAERRIEQVNERLEAGEQELAELQEIFNSQPPSPPRSKRTTPSISPPAAARSRPEVTTTRSEPIEYEEFVALGRPKMVPYKMNRLVLVKKQPAPQQLKRYQGSRPSGSATDNTSGIQSMKQQTTDEATLFAELFGEESVTDAPVTKPASKKRTANEADLVADFFGEEPATKKRSSNIENLHASSLVLPPGPSPTMFTKPSQARSDQDRTIHNAPAP